MKIIQLLVGLIVALVSLVFMVSPVLAASHSEGINHSAYTFQYRGNAETLGIATNTLIQHDKVMPRTTGYACVDNPNNTNCNFQDPIAAGCLKYGSVSTIYTSPNFYVGGIPWYMEMRYSTACQSRWVRLQQYGGNNACSNSFDGVYVAQGKHYPSDIQFGDGVDGPHLCDGAYGNIVYSPHPFPSPIALTPYVYCNYYDINGNWQQISFHYA